MVGKCRRLADAAVQVWTAYLDYGPVDDGRPEGDAFAESLDNLMIAAVGAGAKMPKRRYRKTKKGE
jgi:hypothetical protein